MFEDFAEQEHVFELFEEAAKLDEGESLEYLSGEKSYFAKVLQKLASEIHKKERITIEKNSRRELDIGFSYESQILAEIWEITTYCDTPLRLAANLPRLKHLLMQSMVILHKLKNEDSELEAEYGKFRREISLKNQKKASDARKKYKNTNEWLSIYDGLKVDISFTNAAKIICQRLSLPDEAVQTVRKHLSQNRPTK